MSLIDLGVVGCPPVKVCTAKPMKKDVLSVLLKEDEDVMLCFLLCFSLDERCSVGKEL